SARPASPREQERHLIIPLLYRLVPGQKERKSPQERKINNDSDNDKSGVTNSISQIPESAPSKRSQQDYQKRPVELFIRFGMLACHNGYASQHAPNQQSIHVLPLD